jgi:hypothetical protein
MNWTDSISNILQRYSGAGGGAAAAPEDAHSDFQEVARAAPREAVAGGIAQAFRSDQTPPFPEMVSNLFSHSDPQQQAGLLSHLLGSAGPGASSVPGLGTLLGLVSGNQVTPEQASQVQPEQVRDLAAHAERNNPSVVDQVSGFFSEHPTALKALGGLALSVAIQHMARRS